MQVISLTSTGVMNTTNILSSSTSQTFLKKFIECQFQLKWATRNGWPREFSYYDFCEVISQYWIQRNMRKKVLKNTVRSAQVKVQLYKYYMSHIPRTRLTLETYVLQFMSEQVRNGGGA